MQRQQKQKNNKKGSSASEIVRKDILPSKAIKDRDATQLSERQISLTDETNATDSINAKKQNLSEVIEMCSDTAGDSNKTFDLQETISEEWTDTDFHLHNPDPVSVTRGIFCPDLSPGLPLLPLNTEFFNYQRLVENPPLTSSLLI